MPGRRPAARPAPRPVPLAACRRTSTGGFPGGPRACPLPQPSRGADCGARPLPPPALAPGCGSASGTSVGQGAHHPVQRLSLIHI
eukprot:6929998-Alexandrium_andersonii.AAC.1